ncbi:MAG: serine/threonine-protein kinase [Gemmatimonadaceae bacterium]
MSDLFRDQLVEALGHSYTLDRELTGGGMSRVFVATEHALNRVVVVKVLRQELAADVNRDRFRREIMLAAQLQHPLIVPVLSAGEHRELLWYTMPFVEGESLREEIRRGPPASARSAMRVLHDVLDALHYAHGRGVIHRDIKPGNILRHGNHSLVTDFGVAKALSASLPTSGTTSAGIAIGTPAYMAPEQLAADPSANHRMDLYAVGLLVYELLTGSQAFAESSPQATMAAQLTRMPRDLAEVRADVPPALSSLIMKMLAKSPDDRPQSAKAALDELDAIVTPTGVTAPRVPARTPKVLGALVITGIAAMAAIATFITIKNRQAPKTAIAPVPPPAPAAVRPDSTRIGSTGSKTTGAKTSAPGTSTRAIAAPTASAKAATKAGSGTASKTTTKTAPAPARPAVPLLNRRVAVLPFRVSGNRENVTAAAQAIQDSLQRTLTAAGYTLASDSELLRMVTQQNVVSGGLRRSADAAGMGAVVTVDIIARADEVSAVAQVLDVWRAQTASAREAADPDKPIELANVIRGVVRSLDRVSWRTRADPKRVLVFELDDQTGGVASADVVRLLNDSLRAAVTRYGAATIPLDSTLRSTSDVSERRTLAVRRGAGALVAGSITRLRGDSVRLRVSVRDMSEDRTLPEMQARLPVGAVPVAAGQMIARMMELLGQVNWGPRNTQ